jgi:ABC-type Fe3+ transport system permease subunit
VAVLKDLPITLVLAGPTGIRPLAARLWDRYNEALLADAGAAGLTLLTLTLGGVVLARRLHGR